jgi:SAM-dependent methyltransferase
VSLVDWIDDHFYPGWQSHWDDLAFAQRVERVLSRNAVLLDLGAGAGIVQELNFRGKGAKVVGLDPDPRVLTNPFLDEARVGIGNEIPSTSNSFDVVVSANVFEHVDEPRAMFEEIARVLKPGGLFLLKTPNRRHYIAFIARCTPLWFHRFYNRLRGRNTGDTFSTKYKANSDSALRNLANAAVLELVDCEFIEGRPEYLRLAAATYVFGLLYERIVNRFAFLARYRAVIIATFRKPQEAPGRASHNRSHY